MVCHYSNLSNRTERGTSVSVYTAPQFTDKAKFVLDTAIYTLDHFEDFFGIPYPLPKLGKFPLILKNS